MSGRKRMRLTNRVSNFEVLSDSDRQRLDALHKAGPRPVADGRGWYRIQNLSGANGHVEVYMYDEIGLWGITAAEFVRELSNLSAVHIDLHINSPGGDVWDGIAIYNALCNHPASVTSYVDGLAASAASFIAQAGGRVMIARNATMMIHDAEGICIGNAADMTEMADLLDRASNNIADIYAQRCSTVLQWRKAMKNVSWYVGQEAVDSGLADETYEPEQGSDNEPAERRRKANNLTVIVPTNTNSGTGDIQPVVETESVEPADGPELTTEVAAEEEPAADADISTPEVQEPEPEAAEDISEWWSPDLFKTAVATAADQHRLYGFDADAFKEIMRTAAENCPAPPEPEPVVPVPNAPESTVDSREFLAAIRRGLL